MCHADVSPITFRWEPRKLRLVPELNSEHTCRNFSEIHSWAWEHFIDVPDDKRHVELGKIMDYSQVKGVQLDPDDPLAGAPDGWYHTIDDL
jgi:hypothetical protein